MILRAVARGDVILVRSLNRDEPTMVWSPCERRAVGYFCSSCGTQLANVGQILAHAEVSPPDAVHSIVRWCAEERKYEACDQAQLDALAPQPDLQS